MGRLRAGRAALAVGLVLTLALVGACGSDDDDNAAQQTASLKSGERAAARVVVNLAYLIGCHELASPLLP